MYSGAGDMTVHEDGIVVDVGVSGPRGLELPTVMLSLSVSSSR